MRSEIVRDIATGVRLAALSASLIFVGINMVILGVDTGPFVLYAALKNRLRGCG
jgi:hypothetical protein